MGGDIAQFILDTWEFVHTTQNGLLDIPYPPIHDACCVAAVIDPSIITVEKADVRVELEGRWTKGQTVANFETASGMRHFGGTAAEQTDYRTNVAITLDVPKFADLIVESTKTLTRAKG